MIFTSLHYTFFHTFRWFSLHYTFLILLDDFHFTSLPFFNTFRWFSLHFTTLSFILLDDFHFTSLHFTSLHFTSLPFTTLFNDFQHTLFFFNSPQWSLSLPSFSRSLIYRGEFLTQATINILCGSEIRSSNRPTVKSESHHQAIY